MSEKDEFQEATAPSDGTTRSQREVTTTDFIIESFVATLLFGQSGSRGLRHAINRRHRSWVNDALKRNPECVADCCPPLLHCYRCESWTKNITSRVNAFDGSAKVAVDGDSSPGVELNTGNIKPETFCIRYSSSGKKHG